MTPTMLAWALSLGGAALFFVAGVAFAWRRAHARLAVEPSRAVEGALGEIEVAHHEVAAARAELVEARRERDHFRAALMQEHAQAVAVAAERDRLRAHNEQLAATALESEQTRPDAGHFAHDRARLDAEKLAQLGAERDRLSQQVAVLTTERDRLRSEKAALDKHARETAARAEQARRDAAALVDELKSQRGISAPRQPVFVADGGTRGDALRTILDEETRGTGVAGAVIADELGLVVAATGEYGDALAAYGAFLAEVGAKTRDALPLHELRQVIVQDDHDMTLTVRPIASADDNLALVTLAAGRNGAASRAS